MQYNVIRNLSEMDKLAQEWDSLLKDSASHVPFLRHGYMRSWWQTLGGGEWADGSLNIVTARQDGGGLQGIAPLFYSQNRLGEPALMFLGSIEISDYLDVITRPEHLPVFLDGLLDFLIRPEMPAWKALDWYNLLESSQTLVYLKEFSARKNLVYSEEQLQHCPSIPLPADWETYLVGLDKKQRHEIRRKIRRAEEYPIPLRWYIATDGNQLEQEINDFFILMAYDPAKKKFLTPIMREQMKKTMQLAFDEGWLQLAFVEIGKEKAAAYVNFDYQENIWVYNSGFNPRYWELSLGWVLLAYLIQWAIEHKHRVYDFMRGEEDYKYRFGGVDRRVVRAILRR